MKPICLNAILILTTACLPAWGKLGDTETVVSGSDIPRGWVIIDEWEEIYTNPSHCVIKRKIMDTNGAPTGHKLHVVRGSEIQKGWVITDTWNVGGDYYGFKGPYYKTMYAIENVNGAPKGATVNIIDRSTTPDGWIIVDSWKSKVRRHEHDRWDTEYTEYKIKNMNEPAKEEKKEVKSGWKAIKWFDDSDRNSLLF